MAFRRVYISQRVDSGQRPHAHGFVVVQWGFLTRLHSALGGPHCGFGVLLNEFPGQVSVNLT